MAAAGIQEARLLINKFIVWGDAGMPAKREVTKEMLLSAALELLREVGI